MSNEPVRNHEMETHGSFEKQDLSPRSVIYFFAGLIALLLVIFGVAFGVYRFLDSYNHANQATMSPMVAPEVDTRAVTPRRYPCISAASSGGQRAHRAARIYRGPGSEARHL